MPTKPLITTERVDDLPVLLTQLEGMGVQQLLGDRTLLISRFSLPINFQDNQVYQCQDIQQHVDKFIASCRQ
ncbi:MAG: hypothetical protein KME38_01600 [Spirirestis rafaelensis WJT71-NPBG6]|nr:hypothetical protein [Spirirestis rafaelensis WJT71-NPBG6]